MFDHNMYSGSNKDNYELVLAQCRALIEDEKDMIANMANISSLLYHFLDNVNWVGFYIYRSPDLVLGPFMGKSACTRIPLHKGVCGKAATTLQIQRIEDVHKFPGHIACDSMSNSEIVIPLLDNGKLIGVLDIDSPEFHRFDQQDEDFLVSLVNVFISATSF